MKAWYFERDCSFCTRSASMFCRNPLNFLAHSMWVKWWYHANFQPFQSSFVVLFIFRVIQLKKISKCMKNKKWSQKGLKIDDVALNGAFWTRKKSGVQISLKKWNPFVKTSFRKKPWYFERDCPFCTWSASSFCRNPLYFLAHAMWMKWWYQANFQPFHSSFEMLFVL